MAERVGDEAGAGEADLESMVEQRTRQLSALLEVSNVLASSLDLRQLLDTVVSRTVDVLALADSGFVALFNEKSGKLEAKAGWGYVSSVEQLALEPGEGSTGQAFLEGEPVLLDSSDAINSCMKTLGVENWACMTRMRPGTPTCMMSVPLSIQGRVIGAMTVEHYGNGGHFSQSDLRLAQALAGQVAIAVENARLYQEVRRRKAARGPAG